MNKASPSSEVHVSEMPKLHTAKKKRLTKPVTPPEYGTVGIKELTKTVPLFIVQELCESRGGRPELSVLTSLLVSVDVKNY